MIILHDAAREPEDLLDDSRLVEAITGRGYALIIPQAAMRRENVRAWHKGAYPRPGNIGASNRRYPVTDRDGSIRKLRKGRDLGWYFYNVDAVGTQPDLIVGQYEWEPKGRDEIAFLRDVLFDASAEFALPEDRVDVIIGIGHGGSLAWQIACSAPDLAGLIAPVDGAYWLDMPETCRPGARLLHAHHARSAFWPIGGASTAGGYWPRTPVMDNMRMLSRANECRPESRQRRDDAAGALWRTWGGCLDGATVDYVALDEPFAFQDWWLDKVLGGRATAPATGAAATRDSRRAAQPTFLSADRGSGSTFLKPATGANSRFKAPPIESPAD